MCIQRFFTTAQLGEQKMRDTVRQIIKRTNGLTVYNGGRKGKEIRLNKAQQVSICVGDHCIEATIFKTSLIVLNVVSSHACN